MLLLFKKITASSLMVLLSCSFLRAQQEGKIDSTAIVELLEFSKATYTDEILLIHKNKVVYHWKNQNCDSLGFNTASMVKSWTGLVVGVMIDKGLIKSEDDLICDYIPEWKSGCENRVTIKNLLTMSAGLYKRSGAQGILASSDMNRYAVNLESDTVPNIKFSYSNESVQLLGVLIEKLSNKSAYYYFKEVLFDPLGMNSSELASDSTGNNVVFGGAKTTLEDASKIGLLMLNNGEFNGIQIISESWIKKTTTPSDKASYYGYLWWLDNNSEHKNYAATGDFGQMTIVFPELDLIFMRQQSCNKDVSGNMTWMGPHFLKLISSVVVEK